MREFPPSPPRSLARWLATGFLGGGLFGFCWFSFFSSPHLSSWYLKCGLWQVERCVAERRSWLKVDGWLVFLVFVFFLLLF